MSNYDRAAQFAPFAALTGYDESVTETARRTDARPELAEDEKNEIDRLLRMAAANSGRIPRVSITYFVPDARKNGGVLIDVCERPAGVDEKERLLIFEDGTEVPIDDIVFADCGF